ncbi:MAG: hypothetical protein EPO41_15905 [Reyranella sp.]|uniref:hypothetical protein n=1 Tax=Reyranella sp. TaxID=1929291 RepID=UPI0011FCE4D2|nr:hypothetical protein [Reyranella sp.]TAJ91358.1 MAG: hypothetical protein EPO41_15905 [Reyranella sp.]
MNVLFDSPVGALLARPWVDPVGLYGLRRWYLPLSRLWAAANLAGLDVARFRDGIGLALPGFWSEARLQRLLARHGRAQARAEEMRTEWEAALFDPVAGGDPERLDRERRSAATAHLASRALFYPLLFPRRPPLARWRIDPPEQVERELGRAQENPSALYVAPLAPGSVETSRSFVREGLREYWLRAATPSARLRQRPGSETLYARVVEPVGGTIDTLVFGNGLCVETELMSMDRGPGPQLAAMGWRVIEPVSPYHGLRAMPGFYGGEPFFATSPMGSMDLIAGQAIESGLLVAWARARFAGKVALAGISMSSFVAQLAASHCHLWPAEARPDAALLISHSGRVEDVTFGGALAGMLGLDRALIEAGWARESLARLSRMIDPADMPALPPSRIVSALGETDRWVPYRDGLALAQRWRLPQDNQFRYRFGHLGMPVQLIRDSSPFARLRQVMNEG